MYTVTQIIANLHNIKGKMKVACILRNYILAANVSDPLVATVYPW